MYMTCTIYMYPSVDETITLLEANKLTACSISPTGILHIGINDSVPSGHIVPKTFASRARMFDLLPVVTFASPLVSVQ